MAYVKIGEGETARDAQCKGVYVTGLYTHSWAVAFNVFMDKVVSEVKKDFMREVHSRSCPWETF